MIIRRLFSALATMLLFCGSVPAAETPVAYYVQSPTATIYAQPAFNSEALAQVERGTCFTEAVKQGAWIKVSHKGRPGFISALSTATTPPRTAVAAGQGSERGSAQVKLRGRASQAGIAVAGVKGLAYEDRARASAGARVDFDALAQVESLELTQEELQRFGKGGTP